ncbi:MAG: SCP2 sterol-binding domain-containing protein [Aquihabitans sp.]
MARFLSPEWIDHLDASVREGAGSPDDLSLVVEQQITHPDGEVTQFQVVFADGTVRVRPGTEADADVRFIQDLATAEAIARGEESAQRAFMTGHMRVGGNLQVLSQNGAALSRLTDAFAAVRQGTTFDEADSGTSADDASADGAKQPSA